MPTDCIVMKRNKELYVETFKLKLWNVDMSYYITRSFVKPWKNLYEFYILYDFYRYVKFCMIFAGF